MSIHIVYEKKYSRDQLWADLKKLDEMDESDFPLHTIDELCTIIRNTTYVPCTERLEAGKEFIQTAIALSELYELDIQVVQYRDRIIVDYTFPGMDGLGELKRVFALADELSFAPGEGEFEVAISMEFLTHQRVYTPPEPTE